MAIITKISLQKRAKDRYNVYLDGSYAFPVSEKVLFDFGLKVGQTLDEELIDKIVKDENYEKIYGKILNFLSYRIRTKQEVEQRLREYLFKGEIPENLSAIFEEKILAALENLGLIDDSNFVDLYIQNCKTLKNPPGAQKIRNFLLKRGVDRELISDGLKNYSSEDEEKGAEQALDKKLRNLKTPLNYKEKQKIMQFLMRKGYSLDVVKRVVDSKFEV